jgi:hypothetical protein
MGLLDSIVGILVIHMNGFRDHFPAGDTIASQFVGHDLPRFAIVVSYKPSEVESIVEPDSVGNDIRWKSVTFICIHSPILPNLTS